MRGSHIKKKVGKYYNVDMDSTSRQRELVLPRQITMYLCRKHTELSYSQIAQLLGNKNHTTAMSNVRKIERICEEDEVFKRRIEKIL